MNNTKSIRSGAAWAALALSLSMAGCATAGRPVATEPSESSAETASAGPQAQQRPVALQVAVTVPYYSNPARDYDIAEAFGYRLMSSLYEQGFQGRVRYIERDYRDPDQSVPLLSIDLREWRVDPTGNVDCTFNARLMTPSGSRDLGQFTGTSVLAWPMPNILSRDDAFTTAASNAMSNLVRSIRATGLLNR